LRCLQFITVPKKNGAFSATDLNHNCCFSHSSQEKQQLLFCLILGHFTGPNSKRREVFIHFFTLNCDCRSKSFLRFVGQTFRPSRTLNNCKSILKSDDKCFFFFFSKTTIHTKSIEKTAEMDFLIKRRKARNWVLKAKIKENE
jgi:hypothetical protein